MENIAAALAAAERATQDQLARVVAEQFRELESAVRSAHQQWTEGLNAHFRRMRASKSEDDWRQAVLDAAAGFCRRASLPDSREFPQEDDAALFPIAAGDRIVRVLHAEGPTDPGALELIANFAGSVRPADSPATEHAAARRFAGVAVARIVLHEYAAVVRGRLQRALYTSCARSIDSARERYRKTYPDLPDFLHREIVRTLAHDQLDLLGPDYPGPLHATGRSVA